MLRVRRIGEEEMRDPGSYRDDRASYEYHNHKYAFCLIGAYEWCNGRV